jgi:hypothetical protein
MIAIMIIPSTITIVLNDGGAESDDDEDDVV